MLPTLTSSNRKSTSATSTHHLHLDNNNTQRKRATSMIFRIEHLLPPTAAPTGASNSLPSHRNGTNSSRTSRAEHKEHKRLKLSPRSGVYAAQCTPADTLSESITTQSLLGVLPSMDQAPSSRTYCALTQGRLCVTPTIMRKIKLSEDIPSYNALFEVHNGCVRLRIVRDIARDDEIVAWFDEETTMLMSIPFLTPLNIQGNNRYTCHMCNLVFETPNPLKLHLALGCGRHPIDMLWIRLHYALHTNTGRVPQLPLLAPFPVSSVASIISSTPPLLTTSSLRTAVTTPTPVTQSPTPTYRFSAFTPIVTTSTNIARGISVQSPPATSIVLATASNRLSTVSRATITPVTSHSALSYLPSMSTVTLPTMSMNLLQPPTTSHPMNAAAQIEAIVSNMGASKQGHLCIYCGKVYSRKYGLKIHIRTHTGFKPLKCKFCLRPFGDPSNLNKHVRLHLQSNTSSDVAGEPGYKCHLCTKTLARRRDLQRHIESRHTANVPQTPSTALPEKSS